MYGEINLFFFNSFSLQRLWVINYVQCYDIHKPFTLNVKNKTPRKRIEAIGWVNMTI